MRALRTRLAEVVDSVHPDIIHAHSPVLDAFPRLRSAGLPAFQWCMRCVHSGKTRRSTKVRRAKGTALSVDARAGNPGPATGRRRNDDLRGLAQRHAEARHSGRQDHRDSRTLWIYPNFIHGHRGYRVAARNMDSRAGTRWGLPARSTPMRGSTCCSGRCRWCCARCRRHACCCWAVDRRTPICGRWQPTLASSAWCISPVVCRTAK